MNNLVLVVKMLFNVSYSFMTSFYIPGTQVTPLALTIAGLFIYITWKLIFKLFGVPFGSKEI